MNPQHLPATTPLRSLQLRQHLSLPEPLLSAAKNIRAIIFDVDGVLTDGRLYYSEQGEVLKAFHSLDGHGLKMLHRAGLQAMVISGRDSPALRTRLAHIGVMQFALGTEDKLPAAEKLLAAAGLDWSQVAAMGDDWPDLPLLSHAALGCAPANAHHEVLASADWVTQAHGGMGAARELIDLVLHASGQYHSQLAQHRAGRLQLAP